MGMSFGSFASRSVATNIVAKDGTGDFTDIQAAIDALPSTGGVVFVKEGTYIISSTIEFGKALTLTGSGKSTTILEAGFDGTMIDMKGFGGVINNIQLKGKLTGTVGIGLITGGSFNVFINNILTQFFTKAGINIDGSQTILSNSSISSNKSDGIVLDTNVSNIIIQGCRITDNEGHGISITTAHEIVISGNIISDQTTTKDGIFLSAADRVTITGNIIESNTNYGINVSNSTSDKTLIVGNQVFGNTTGDINDVGTNTLNASNLA